MYDQRKIKDAILFDCFLIAALLLNFFIIQPAFGTTGVTDSIEAKIKISICGNNLVEGGEDCDGSDLNNKSCQDLGYDSGNLNCGIACDFDTSDCSGKIETTPMTISTNMMRITPTPAIIRSQRQKLPLSLNIFDIDNSGRFEQEELADIIRLWVSEWREKSKDNSDCDLDNNLKCNLTDFSILLYYIGK